MKVSEIEQELKYREYAANRLEYSILFLQSQPDNYKHQEALRLLEAELFFRKDQLFNYQILVNLLRDENNEQMPKQNQEII